jgi:hypothetical protein
VAVVGDERDRPLRGQVGGEPVERVASGEGIGRHRGGRAVHRDLEQRRREPRGAGEQHPRVDPSRQDHVVEQLADHAEDEVALELGAARAKGQQPSVDRLRDRDREQRRLPDPGRAVQDHETAVSLARPAEGVPHGRELGVALEERGRRQDRRPHGARDREYLG